MRRLRLAPWVLLLLLLLRPLPAGAGNYESNYYSNEAALSAGAVTALTRDAGATWYNPAGLGGQNRKEIDLTANAFMLRIRNTPGALVNELPDGDVQTDLDSTEILPIPSSIIFTRDLGEKVSIGFGVFVVDMDYYSVRAELSQDEYFADPGRTLRYQNRLEVSGESKYIYLGPAVGYEVSPRLRLGCALFGAYFTGNDFQQVWVRLADPTPDDQTDPEYLSFGFAEGKLNFKSYGLAASFGAQWEIDEHWSAGLLFRTPTWAIHTTLEESGVNAWSERGDPAGPDSDFDGGQTRETFNLEEAVPLAVTFGFGYRRPGWTLAAEFDYHAPLDSEKFQNNTGGVFNARVGGTWEKDEQITLGAGFFTDLSNDRSTPFIGPGNIDYYGGTLGVIWRSSHALLENQKPDALVFTTSVSLRYAYGFGPTGTLRYDPRTPEGFEQGVTEATRHEISLNVGTGLYFW